MSITFFPSRIFKRGNICHQGTKTPRISVLAFCYLLVSWCLGDDNFFVPRGKKTRLRRCGLLGALAGLLILASAQAASLTVTGTVTYKKTVYSRSSSQAESTVDAPVRQAIVKAFEGSAELPSSTTTNDSGAYSFTVNFSSAFTLKVYTARSSNAVEVRATDSGGAEGALYSADITATAVNTAGPHNKSISTSENSGAFNIFDQFMKGRDWFASKGYSFSRTVKALWPYSGGTQFSPEKFAVYVQNLSNDPDQFDDDVLLHEFGHMSMEEFSVDHSKGGQHDISGKYDIRLTWSEGVAHFVSSAIRDDSLHVDSTGAVNGGISTTSKFDLASPSSAAKGAENEWAVGHVLWNAWKNVSANTTLSAIAGFKNLPAAISDDPISLDTFNDLWTGASLAAYYSDRGMSYVNDDFAANSESSPFTISDPALYSKSNITFFPNGNKDYFSFTAAAGEHYDLLTENSANGALTTLNVYRGSLAQLVGTNSQRNGLPTDTTSYVFLNVQTAGTYIVQVVRFRSQTQNFGLAELSSSGTAGQYSKTAGRYGSYTFSMQKTQSATGNPSVTINAASSSSSSTPTSTSSGTTVTTASGGGGGGGGGGCFSPK